MFRIAHFVILICSLSGFQAVYAQNSKSRTNAWFRGTLNIRLNEKYSVDAEFQHRRQNGFDNCNMLDKTLMFSGRSWLHYQPKQGVKYSLSPFAYFSNSRLIRVPGDDTLRPVSEFRFSAALDIQKPLLRKTGFLNRTALEYRVFSGSQNPVMRLRNRSGLRCDFSNRLKLGMFDELLLNISGTDLSHFFDQNRIGFSIEYEVIHGFQVEAGYLHLIRLPANDMYTIPENNFFLNLSYHLRSK